VSVTITTDETIDTKLVELQLLLGSQIEEKTEVAEELLDHILESFIQGITEISMIKVGDFKCFKIRSQKERF